MLPRVLLHVVEAACPVEPPVNFVGHQFTRQKMQRPAIGGTYFQDRHAVQLTEIAWLPAARGVEGGAVQHHRRLTIHFQPPHDASVKLLQIWVVVI